MRSKILSIAFTALTFAAAPSALAQSQPDPGAQAEDPQRVVEARNLYSEGLRLFQRRQFAEAVVSFERSFRLRPHPFTLYNAAEARMRAGDAPGALGQLRDLLAMTTPPPDEELASRARLLAQQMGEQNLQATPSQHVTCPSCPPPPPQRECPPPPPSVRVVSQVSPAAWALGGASLVLVATGAAFLGVAVDNASTYADARTPMLLQEDLRSQGETYRIVGVVGLVAGVSAAVGAVWMLTHPRRVEEPAPMARVDFGLGPSGVAVSGSF